MAQTTGQITGATGKLEISIDGGSTYIDISGSSSSVDTVEFSRTTGSQTTFKGDYRIVTAGKQPVTSITINALYTEVVGETALLAISGIKNGDPIKVRWQYADIAETTYLRYFTLGIGKVKSVSLPSADAENGEPLMFSFTADVPGIDYEQITPPEE